MAGLTDAGFVAPTLQEILADIEAAQRAAPAIGPNVDQSTESALGQINGIVAQQLRVQWEALAAVYGGLDPDGNTGALQDHVAGLTGTFRRAASAARTAHSVTLAAGTYAVGSLVIRPTGTTANATNIEEIVAPGGVVAGVIFEAVTAGATAYTTATVYEIASPLTGFTAVSVPSAVTNGRGIENAEELRVRRELEAQGSSGSTSVDAIRSAVLAADIGAEIVSVYENVTGVEDARGVPPYSVEAIVQGPTSPTSDDDLALATVIFETKAGGVRAAGEEEVVVTDSQGHEHVIGFSRPAPVTVKSAWSLRVSLGVYNADAVKAAIVAFAPLDPGEELQWTAFLAAGRAAGVTDVVAMTMARTADTLGTANLTATIREYFTMQVSEVTITVVP